MSNKANEIDININALVHCMNNLRGIKTLFSCSGHKLGEQGYITFKAVSQQSLLNFISLLPQQWKRCGWIEDKPFSVHLWVSVELMPKYGMVYSLRFSGNPFYLQMELIREIEHSLSQSVKTN